MIAWFIFPAVVLVPILAGRASMPPREPLPARIDKLITAGTPDYAKKAAPLADDAEFLRRVYLDFTGTIPASADVRVFFADKSPDKRAKLLDKLLAGPEFARRMQYVFDVLFMDRLPDKQVPAADWQKYLRESFAANKPYDVLVREILSADGADPKTRPAAKFYLDRDADPNRVTRDIGRLFLGKNMTCCQCHDHPIVNAYKQEHYYGLLSFVGRTTLFTEAKPAVLAEKAEGDTTFTSVFDQAKAIKTALVRVPGEKTIAEPKLEKGKEYKVAPAKGVRPVPQFSRRAQLAPALTSSRQFARTTANRLWAMLMGQGLIHPVEFDHLANPPSHPELLDVLTDELIARKFDVRAFLKDLALSQTYQRTSKRTGDAEPERFFAMSLKPLSPDQLAWSLMQACGLPAGERNENQVRTLVSTFGGKPGEPESGFQATLDQTLFVANGPLLRQWLTPRAGTLTERLAKQKDAVGVADELFLSVLTRQPTAEEVNSVADYMKAREKDRPAALQEMAWALLASAEFRFNH